MVALKCGLFALNMHDHDEVNHFSEMDRHALLASIESLRSRKEQLRRELNEVKAEIKIRSAKYSRLLNEDAPIYRLPDEVLSSIFLLVQRNYTTYPRHHLQRGVSLLHVKAAHVSHRWRSVVLATPLLWNTISFHIRPAQSTSQRILPLLDAHLLHSAHCVLDIDLNFDLIETDLTPYISRLAVHASRWRRLSIAMYKLKPHMDALKELFLTVNAPALELLSLSLGDPFEEEKARSPRRAYPSLDGAILAAGAPALKFARLAGHAFGQMHPPLQSITTLHLDGWTRNYITPDQLTHVLAGVPRLVNLSLNQFFMNHPRDPTVFPQPVTLPHLRELRLRELHSSPGRFCALIDAPHLHGLTLCQIDPFEFEPMLSVRHVTIDGCGFDAAHVTKVARATPNVVALTAETTLGQMLKGLLPGEGEGAAAARPWPALRELQLWDMEVGDMPHLCHLVLALHELGVLAKNANGDGGGLRQISLDRRGRGLLYAKDRMDWMKERVDVVKSGEQETWPFGLGYRDPHHEVL